MNIQIFGKSKCFDTKKAERYFKERKIKYQLINMTEKGMSKGEYNSVKQAVGGYENLIDEKAKDKDTLMLIKYLADEAKRTNCLKILNCSKHLLSETADRRLSATNRRYGKHGNKASSDVFQ